MKQWQIDALRRIEVAATCAKKQVMESTGDYDRVSGELDLWLTSYVERPGDYYDRHTLTNKIYIPL